MWIIWLVAGLLLALQLSSRGLIGDVPLILLAIVLAPIIIGVMHRM